MHLTYRSQQKELIDGTGIPFPDIQKNMEELAVINQRLGGHSITLEGFKEIAGEAIKTKTLLVCEIGCGGGDNLKVINDYCQKNNYKVDLLGIDINPEVIQYARSNCSPLTNILFITADYAKVKFDRSPDIIFSSLFCHHFADEQLKEMWQWSFEHSRLGFFVNDLHRHWLAFYSIKILSKLFSNSYLVKNDAPVSVCRGFRKKEMKKIFRDAGITNFSIHWKWAFRWLVIVKKQS